MHLVTEDNFHLHYLAALRALNSSRHKPGIVKVSTSTNTDNGLSVYQILNSYSIQLE